MLLSPGDDNSYPVKIKDDFVPKTVYALKWSQMSNGMWFCVDRGATADTYDAEIRLYGTEAVINNFINLIELNRSMGNTIQLSDFNSQEHIFGADIDYTNPLDCTVFMQRRIQGSWKGFGVTLGLSLMSPSFIGGTGSLPLFRFLDYGYDADSNYTINKFDSYDRTFFYQDHVADDGSFTGVFTFSNEEMIALRRYIATNRANTIAMPTFAGVAYPFGRRTPGSYANIINFEDQGMINLNVGIPRWRAKITIAEIIGVSVVPTVPADFLFAYGWTPEDWTHDPGSGIFDPTDISIAFLTGGDDDLIHCHDISVGATSWEYVLYKYNGSSWDVVTSAVGGDPNPLLNQYGATGTFHITLTINGDPATIVQTKDFTIEAP